MIYGWEWLVDEHVGKERPRGGQHYYTPARTRRQEKLIRDAYVDGEGPCWPPSVPIHLTLAFYFSRPPSHLRVDGMQLSSAGLKAGEYWHTYTPDLDNLEKLVVDALNEIAWADDKQIVRVEKQKIWVIGPNRIRMTTQEAGCTGY